MADTVPNPTIPYRKLAAMFKTTRDPRELRRLIVNAPFSYPVPTALLFLGIICLYLVDEKRQRVSLVGVSTTDEYALAIESYEFDETDYHIALDSPISPIAKAIRHGKPESTSDWGSLSRREASSDAARLNQANSGIACSVVYSLTGKTKGALMFSYFQYHEALDASQEQFMQQYTSLAAAALDELAAK